MLTAALALAAGLAFGVIAIPGLPPFGAYMSGFLILASTFAREPLLVLAAAFGLLVSFGALLLRLQNVLFGAPSTPDNKVNTSSLPSIVHLSLVLMASLYLPAALVG
jgi:hydrogenase-4 component F